LRNRTEVRPVHTAGLDRLLTFSDGILVDPRWGRLSLLLLFARRSILRLAPGARRAG
jgi:hypothetical protein